MGRLSFLILRFFLAWIVPAPPIVRRLSWSCVSDVGNGESLDSSSSFGTCGAGLDIDFNGESLRFDTGLELEALA